MFILKIEGWSLRLATWLLYLDRRVAPGRLSSEGFVYSSACCCHSAVWTGAPPSLMWNSGSAQMYCRLAGRRFGLAQLCRGDAFWRGKAWKHLSWTSWMPFSVLVFNNYLSKD